MEYRYERCAYHPTQSLKSFCKCKQCLLPLCQVCQKVHTSQHRMNSTEPQFQKLDNMFSKTNNQIKALQYEYSRLILQITKVEEAKRRQSSDLKEIFKRKRTTIIKQFEAHLIELEELFLKNLADQQKEFIDKIQTIDQQVCSVHQNLIKQLVELNKKEYTQDKFSTTTVNAQKRKIKQNLFNTIIKKQQIKNLSTPSSLKVLIEYLSENHFQTYEEILSTLRERVATIKQDKIDLVSLEQQSIQRMKQAIIEYFTIYKCTTGQSNYRVKLIQNY